MTLRNDRASRTSFRRTMREQPSDEGRFSPVSAISRENAGTDRQGHANRFGQQSSYNDAQYSSINRSSSFRRQQEENRSSVGRSSSYRRDDDQEAEYAEHHTGPTRKEITRATRPRLIWALITSLLLLIAVVFLILVEIGNIRVNPILDQWYFIKLDLSNIIPVSVPNAILINSIAQTLGLHDFYTVGLWGYCEGYNGQGITQCSKPQNLYWFNPVEILRSQLLAGATIALPADVDKILHLIRIVSHWMFGLFLAGVVMCFVTMIIAPLSWISRWATLPTVISTFIAALLTTVASVLATVLFVVMRNAISGVQQLNIQASLGLEMFIFMWIASGTAIAAFIIQLCLLCCCASRRDVKTGRKKGSVKRSASKHSKYEEKDAGRFSSRMNGDHSQSTRRYSNDEEE